MYSHVRHVHPVVRTHGKLDRRPSSEWCLPTCCSRSSTIGNYAHETRRASGFKCHARLSTFTMRLRSGSAPLHVLRSSVAIAPSTVNLGCDFSDIKAIYPEAEGDVRAVPGGDTLRPSRTEPPSCGRPAANPGAASLLGRLPLPVYRRSCGDGDPTLGARQGRVCA
jgi:hypothetical protein